MDVRCFEQQNMHFWKRLLFIAVFQNVFFDCGEAFRADDMLHAAGILLGSLWLYTCIHQQLGEKAVFFIGTLCYFASSS